MATLLLVLLMPSGGKPVVLVMGCCAAGVLVTGWLADSVLSKDNGTPAMRAVSDPIKVGDRLSGKENLRRPDASDNVGIR